MLIYWDNHVENMMKFVSDLFEVKKHAYKMKADKVKHMINHVYHFTQ